MHRFLIEVPHDASLNACNRAIDVFVRTGSHFLMHADWGCKDNEHKAWMTVEVESKEEARNIVPAEFRESARIVRLTRFTRSPLEAAKGHSGPKSG